MQSRWAKGFKVSKLSRSNVDRKERMKDRMKKRMKERKNERKKERQETKEQQTFFASSGFDEREPNQNQKCLCQDIRKIAKQRLFSFYSLVFWII